MLQHIALKHIVDLVLKNLLFHKVDVKLIFKFCHNSLGRRGPGNILQLLSLNGFRRQRSHSFIGGFLLSVCSGSNLKVTVICLIWKSLPNHFDMLHPSMFNYKLLSPIVDIICFSFPQILVSVFKLPWLIYLLILEILYLCHALFVVII